jgi:hypothetical protein
VLVARDPRVQTVSRIRRADPAKSLLSVEGEGVALDFLAPEPLLEAASNVVRRFA